nr:uncharacterized protein LOC123775052 [Procambarus clarkii]
MPVLQDLWLTMTTILVTTLLCMAYRPRQISSRIKQQGMCGNATLVADLIRKGNCRPVEQPVPVPIPSGYESVTPAVVMVTRCQGLSCYPSSYSCIPLYVTDLIIPVYAHAHRRTRTCMEVKVEQHTGCRCACDRTCPVNQVLNNKDECACVCDSKEQEMCEVRQRLWDATTCSCVCPPALVSQCSSGEVFIPELCRCELY